MSNAQKFTWNNTDLEQLRHVMDPPSDKAVESIFESRSMRHLATILEGMARDDDFVSKELPESMHNFVQKELDRSFTSEDIQMFNETHRIWKRDGMKFIFILFFRALPYTYMAEKPANVLRMTRLLETQTERRIFETAQFVFDVMDKHWWKPRKRGILTALKIRIMHSAIRKVILDSHIRNEEWNHEWGKPISQEDLIATNQVFSLEFFKGMAMLGESLSEQEQEAWFHTWKTIGRIMGVQEHLICEDVEEAWTLQHAVYDHLFRDTTHSGILLAERLVQALDHFHMPEHMVLHFMKRMLADEKFPDCFDRMLGPTYKEKYPHLFQKHITEEERENHKARLRGQLHEEIKEYHTTMTDKKHRFKKKQDIGFFGKLFMLLRALIGRRNKNGHLIDIHLDKIKDTLHDEQGEPLEELGEDLIINIMSALGGIMVSVLSVHFRQGKETGFRIPASLQDNWALKG